MSANAQTEASWKKTNPLTQAGTAYRALKALYWLLYYLETPQRQHMLDLVDEIEDDLQKTIKEMHG